jgi:hypothetical protein
MEKMYSNACGAPHGLKSERISILQLQSVVLPGKFGNGVGQELASDGLQMAPCAQKGESQESNGLVGLWPFMVLPELSLESWSHNWILPI